MNRINHQDFEKIKTCVYLLLYAINPSMIRLTLISIVCCLIHFGCQSNRSEREIVTSKNDSLTYGMAKEYDSSIYIGRVTGNIPDSFQKHTNNYYKNRDSLFKLKDLTVSSNQIEIRVFTKNLSDTSYCIVLAYDTSFSISGLKHYFVYNTVTNNFENRKSVLTKVSINTNPDSLFAKLVENGVFSLDVPSKVNYSKYPLLRLTKKGFKEGTTIGEIMDGVDFTLEYKVDKFYDRIYINNPSTYYKHNPDFQTYRRKYEITKLMMSGLL